jgi:RNA polymerase sigma-70 factor, ECF subfamily
MEATALETAARDALAAARARWPELAIDDTTFLEVVAERALTEIPPFFAELVLATACVRGDEAAIRYFHREMFERVDRVLSRLGLSTADADDIKQEIRTKLLLGDAKLAQYQGSGPLAQWVASVAGREALGQMRKKKPSEALGADDDLLDAADDPALRTLKTRHGAEFKQAFQATVADLEPRDRAILRAMIVDDRSVNEIAAVYGIHRVTASRWVSEIRHALLEGTRRRLREKLRLDEGSLDSAIRMIDSNLDMSLFRLLHGAA